MSLPPRDRPAYAIASVDHALRLASMLQLEGELTVSEAADRLGVARSTAHRFLQMLVYRDFAVQRPDRRYGAGPVLQLAEYSRSATARLRSVALPHMHRLVRALDESTNLTVRTGTEVRFIASVESTQVLRMGSREGMVFPAHRTSGGLVLLAELEESELTRSLDSPTLKQNVDLSGNPIDLVPVDRAQLRAELNLIRRQGFAVNNERSERGVVAIGVPVRDPNGNAVAGLAVAMPSVRYDPNRLPPMVATLTMAADGIRAGLE